MIFKRLHLENFKQYEKLNLEFQEGLVGIIGRNGSGKSTLFEAILLCLFGKSNTEKEYYRSSWVDGKKHVVLELVFELHAKTYRIRREFRGKALAHQAGLYNHQDVQIATSASSVNEEVTQLLGMDDEAFTRSIFSGQKELGILSETKGEQRKLMVRKMVGLDHLDRIQQLVREDRNTRRRMIQGQQALLLSADELKGLEKESKVIDKQLQKENKVLERLEKAFQKKEASYQKAKKSFNQLSKKQQRYTELENVSTKYEEGLEHLDNQRQELEEKIKSLQSLQLIQKSRKPEVQQYLKDKATFTKLEQLKEKYDLLQNLNEKAKYIDNQLLTIEKNQGSLENIEKEGLQTKEAIATLQQQLEQLTAEKEQLAAAQNKLSSQQGAVNAKIEERRQHVQTIQQIGREAPCPTCLQPLVNTYDTTLAKLQQEIEQYQQKELQSLMEQQETLKEQIATLNHTIEKTTAEWHKKQKHRTTLGETYTKLKDLYADKAKLQKEMIDLRTINFDPKKYQQLRERLAKQEPSYLEYVQRATQLEVLPNSKAQLKTIKERMTKGKALLKSTAKDIKALQFSPSKFNKQQRHMDELEVEKDTALHSLNTQKEQIQTIERQQLSTPK